MTKRKENKMKEPPKKGRREERKEERIRKDNVGNRGR
jgi:hypothetical protein